MGNQIAEGECISGGDEGSKQMLSEARSQSYQSTMTLQDAHCCYMYTKNKQPGGDHGVSFIQGSLEMAGLENSRSLTSST